MISSSCEGEKMEGKSKYGSKETMKVGEEVKIRGEKKGITWHFIF